MIVIDTNVVISGTFFGGFPRQILKAVFKGEVSAIASPEIIEEYLEILKEMIDRKQGKLSSNILFPFLMKLKLIEPNVKVDVSQDPDDNKFISCALSGHALFIVSGDKDLLDIDHYNGIEIITAKDFCSRYLEDS